MSIAPWPPHVQLPTTDVAMAVRAPSMIETVGSRPGGMDWVRTSWTTFPEAISMITDTTDAP
ncbi:hypothetical protein FE89_16935 [Azospirillum brasilense]|nr:hypothetical protein AMK58_15290 [Azospirillum brasilense]OPH14437.1 hypothetical protein FE89_16935 [Azospirillum brasilense]